MANVYRAIKLNRYAVDTLNWTYYGAYRLRVEAVDAVGPDLNNYVFIVASRPADPYTGENKDEFMAVCGPAQMASIPIGAPDANNNFPFYRVSAVELDFTSQSQALDVFRIIQEEVRILVESMGKFSQLQLAESIQFTNNSDDGTVDSQSTSIP